MTNKHPAPSSDDDLNSLAHDLLGVDLSSLDDTDEPLDVDGLGLDDLGFGVGLDDDVPASDSEVEQSPPTGGETGDDPLAWIVRAALTPAKPGTPAVTTDEPEIDDWDDDDFGGGLLAPPARPAAESPVTRKVTVEVVSEVESVTPVSRRQEEDFGIDPEDQADAVEDRPARRGRNEAPRDDAYWDALEGWNGWEEKPARSDARGSSEGRSQSREDRPSEGRSERGGRKRGDRSSRRGRDDSRRGEGRRDEPRREEVRSEESRREEPRRDEKRRDDTRRPGSRPAERETVAPVDEADDFGVEPVRRDERPRRGDASRREEVRQDEPQRADGRREDSRREEGRREEGGRGENRRDDNRRPREDRSRRGRRGERQEPVAEEKRETGVPVASPRAEEAPKRRDEESGSRRRGRRSGREEEQVAQRSRPQNVVSDDFGGDVFGGDIFEEPVRSSKRPPARKPVVDEFDDEDEADLDVPVASAADDDGFGAGLEVDEPRRRRPPPSPRRAESAAPEARQSGRRPARQERPAAPVAEERRREPEEELVIDPDRYAGVPTWEHAISLLVKKQPKNPSGRRGSGGHSGGGRGGDGRRRGGGNRGQSRR